MKHSRWLKWMEQVLVVREVSDSPRAYLVPWDHINVIWVSAHVVLYKYTNVTPVHVSGNGSLHRVEWLDHHLFPSPFTYFIYHLPFWLRLKVDYRTLKECDKSYNTPFCEARNALWFSKELGMMKQLGRWLEHTCGRKLNVNAANHWRKHVVMPALW